MPDPISQHNEYFRTILSSATVPGASKTLRVAVMSETIWIIDMIGAEILFRMRFEILQEAAKFSPHVKELLPHAFGLELYYLSTTLEPTVPVHSNFAHKPNMTYDQCPRDLDIVIVGGPRVDHRPAAADKFMKEAWEKTPVWLTLDTGSMWLASSGVLNGIEAANHDRYHSHAKETHDKVKWVHKRWMSSPKPYEGKSSLKPAVWTSGGTGGDFDTVASFCHANFNPDLVKYAVTQRFGHVVGSQDCPK